MPCYNSRRAWRGKSLSATGKRPLAWRVSDGYYEQPVEVPCGKCLGCRKRRASSWALRCLHESKLHMASWFVTLTYSDEWLPKDGSLQVEHWQKFMKRFRQKYGPTRFFMCGQYGEKTLRAHYHALLFGCDFPDRRLHVSGADSNRRLWTSKTLDGLWGYGQCKIAPLSEQTISYVVGYMNRSVLTKEKCIALKIQPEFQLMSRRPGIGEGWMKLYYKDIYLDDAVVVRGGTELRPPRYYDSLMERIDPVLITKLRLKRAVASKKDVNNTPKRVFVRGVVAHSKDALFRGNDPE